MANVNANPTNIQYDAALGLLESMTDAIKIARNMDPGQFLDLLLIEIAKTSESLTETLDAMLPPPRKDELE